ncbi:hypothetical conserved protein [Candidatus Nitrosoglobus terrae]|uniref:Hypothetical conserved protein n=1 Tax=Candidatus Nitrosoglobus terrae TaxID=1630141 RepID=A0A1Q2SN74_9GAMM|nr:sulfotransferase [Candidatus Nitrosoglobus terrae]BAW80584.1 hypothetical conserved protein [Candidatus Nitrosoglobus terrae]
MSNSFFTAFHQYTRRQLGTILAKVGFRYTSYYQKQRAIERLSTIAEGIRYLEHSSTDKTQPSSEEAPIFIFSAGWRSGSTLLQRLICSSGNTLIWGEPYAHCNYIQTLASTLQPFNQKYPPEHFYLKNTPQLKDLSAAWIANLYPESHHLKAAHLQFFDYLFAQPAKAAGAQHWGLKEVRLNTQHALYLKWLYPKAKFLFLYRNVYNAYRSYKGLTYYAAWPNHPVPNAYTFAKFWTQLVQDYLQNAKHIGGVLIPFEKLTSSCYEINQLAEYLNLELDSNVLSRRITGHIGIDAIPRHLSWYELMIIRQIAGSVAKQLGYNPTNH